ncbi:MAG: AI-2E family transporter [Legionella sp.]|nr:AI-2E family transporter [Legionella sp.]
MISYKFVRHSYWLLAIIVLLILVWYTVDVFLLAFAGILLAIIINSLTYVTMKYTRLSYNISFTMVVIGLFLSILALCFFIAPAISEQAAQLYTKIPEAWNKFSNDILTFIHVKFPANTGQQLSLQNALPKAPGLLLKVSRIFTSTFGFFGNFFVILFFGLSLAYQSSLYINGFVNLFPQHKQSQVAYTLEEINLTLRAWLAGKFLSMLIIGVLTWFSLWMLDIPLAFTLAFLAAILSFIPNIGPIISAVPAILLGLLQSPMTALYVTIVYLVIQAIESYIVTPIIQQKSISLPAGLIVFMQLIMSLLTGLLGLTLATPLLAVISVMVSTLYLKKETVVYDNP